MSKDNIFLETINQSRINQKELLDKLNALEGKGNGNDDVVQEIQEIKNALIAEKKKKARHCIECGAKILDDALFCHYCGAKRQKCQCGEFLDKGMRFCPKCGKINPKYKTKIEKEQREKQKEKEEKRILGSAEINDKSNFIDKGEYIELVKPIGNIRMIQKGIIRKKGFLFDDTEFDWNTAQNLAKELGIGGFRDWRIPTLTELKAIIRITDLCGLDVLDTEDRDYWTSDEGSCNVFEEEIEVMGWWDEKAKAYILCVR